MAIDLTDLRKCVWYGWSRQAVALPAGIDVISPAGFLPGTVKVPADEGWDGLKDYGGSMGDQWSEDGSSRSGRTASTSTRSPT
jgi:hypothetical protein